jgi:hypothetical protein
LAKGLRGGFAWVAHVTSLALAAQGFEVTLIAPRPPEFPEEVKYKNLNIITFPYTYHTSSIFKNSFSLFSFSKVVRRIDADVFLSIDATLETVLLNYLYPRSGRIVWAQILLIGKITKHTICCNGRAYKISPRSIPSDFLKILQFTEFKALRFPARQKKVGSA